MHLTYTPPIQLTYGPAHHAFTSCARWRNETYVAYREADTHHPFPPGRIQIRRGTMGGVWSTVTFWDTDIGGDLRDPRLVATPEALYCLCGGYLPRAPRTTVSLRASENLMQSYVTYTEDGHQWAPLAPVARPNYWLWSALPLKDFWAVAAYHTGVPGESSSIHLLVGDSLLTVRPHAVLYDGASMATDAGVSALRYTYPHALVAEPVLYQPTPDTLACAVRSEDADKCMELGVSRAPYQDWRWHNIKQIIHPSALCATPYGLLLAGRELVKRHKTWDAYTALYHLDGHDISHLARLPSAYDTGYAGLCPGSKDDEYLCSYYSQHTTGTMYDTPLPGAHVFVTTLSVHP